LADTSASRLTSRPDGRAGDGSAPAGLHRLGLGQERDGVLFVPPGLRADRPAPLMISLHGAGSRGSSAVSAGLLEAAEKWGALVLAPDSRGPTWDVLIGGFGPDVDFLDAALDGVFDAVAVDPRRLIISGFSDGASYALSLGLSNGDLFTHVVAFSPGFMAPDAQRGNPPVFVSHGTADPVLNVDACSRALVPILEQAGYGVTYAEFEGGHEVPRSVLRHALDWLRDSPAAGAPAPAT
jgi:phospholipase/carboxylesterase